MTARVYCAVLLCLSGCWSSTEAAPGQNFTVKPGVCPSYGPIMCFMKGIDLCAYDSECPNNEKCCSTACGGRQCTAPVTVKPGVCPLTNSEEIMCVMKDKQLCADDSVCPKNEKCCSTACGGTRCTAPVTVKPGVCPWTNYEEIICKKKGLVLCADDSKCPKNEKCCSTACGGTRCTAPVTVKPGVCPRTNGEVIRCIMKGEELCADDSVCPKNEKCCSTACGGTRCMAPVTVNPGVCPSRTYEPGMCALIRFVSCVDDSDCAKNVKCCSNGCGLQCMAPV